MCSSANNLKILPIYWCFPKFISLAAELSLIFPPTHIILSGFSPLTLRALLRGSFKCLYLPLWKGLHTVPATVFQICTHRPIPVAAPNWAPEVTDSSFFGRRFGSHSLWLILSLWVSLLIQKIFKIFFLIHVVIFPNKILMGEISITL